MSGTKHRRHEHSETVIRARIAHWEAKLSRVLAERRAAAPVLAKAARPPSRQQIRLRQRRIRMERLARLGSEARS